MIRVAGVIAAFLSIILLDIPTLLKTNKRKKTAIIYFALILVGFTISFLLVLDKAPTSPSVLIEDIIKNISGS